VATLAGEATGIDSLKRQWISSSVSVGSQLEEEDMQTDEIRTLLHSQPFVPFTIHLADGREMRVEHPDFVATAPEGNTIIVYEPDGSFAIVDLSLAVDAEIKAQKVS